MTSGDLWALEHGAALLVLVLAAAALLGALAGPAASRWLRDAGRRRVLRALGTPLTHAGDARTRDATVEGTLEGDAVDGVLALQRDAGSPPEGPSRWRASSLTLVSPLGRISLEGELELRAGARSVDARVGDGEALTLRRGDVVRARGVLTAASAGAAHGDGYRDTSTAWRLVAGGEGAILAAQRASTAVRATAGTRLSFAAMAVGLAAVGVAAVGVLGVARADALRGREQSQGARLVCEGAGLRWGVVAALSPLTRRRARDGILRSLSCREVRGWREVDAQDRVLRLDAEDATRSCLQRADLFERAGRFERAAELYEGCGTAQSSDQAARLWAFVARYDRASAVTRGATARATDPVALTRNHAAWHLLAGDRAAARAALDRARSLFASRRAPLRRRGYGYDEGASVGRVIDCALRFLDAGDGAEAAWRAAPDCANELVVVARPERQTCADDLRMTRLDEGAGAASSEHALGRVGREALREAIARGETRAVLAELRAEPPHRAVDLLVALIRRGQRSDEDRARVRAWVETEFPHNTAGRYDAGTLRWIAGATDHAALLETAREISARRCEAQRRWETDPPLRALSAL